MLSGAVSSKRGASSEASPSWSAPAAAAPHPAYLTNLGEAYRTAGRALDAAAAARRRAPSRKTPSRGAPQPRAHVDERRRSRRGAATPRTRGGAPPRQPPVSGQPRLDAAPASSRRGVDGVMPAGALDSALSLAAVTITSPTRSPRQDVLLRHRELPPRRRARPHGPRRAQQPDPRGAHRPELRRGQPPERRARSLGEAPRRAAAGAPTTARG